MACGRVPGKDHFFYRLAILWLLLSIIRCQTLIRYQKPVRIRARSHSMEHPFSGSKSQGLWNLHNLRTDKFANPPPPHSSIQGLWVLS